MNGRDSPFNVELRCGTAKYNEGGSRIVHGLRYISWICVAKQYQTFGFLERMFGPWKTGMSFRLDNKANKMVKLGSRSRAKKR